MSASLAPLGRASRTLERLAAGRDPAEPAPPVLPAEVAGLWQAVEALRGHLAAERLDERRRRRLDHRQAQLLAYRQEMSVARRIQQGILPAAFPAAAGVDMHALMQPAREVGGDFFDAFTDPAGRIWGIVADVSGKGLSAALFMAVARTELAAAGRPGPEPAAALAVANGHLARNNPSAMFVTAAVAVLDPASGTVAYALAGHPPPLVVAADGTVRTAPGGGDLALGILEGQTYTAHSLTLEAGSALFLYTDGLTEAVDPAGAEFGAARLGRLLGDLAGRPAAEVTGAVAAAVGDFAGAGEPFDDLTCLVLGRQTAPQDRAPGDALSLTLADGAAGLAPLLDALDGWCRRSGVPDGVANSAGIAVDELVANALSHGRPQGPQGPPVSVTAEVVPAPGGTGRCLRLVVEDGGRPFDPLDRPAPDTAAAADDRPVGGLGIHLVRSMMDRVAYERSADRNRLVMEKDLPP